MPEVRTTSSTGGQKGTKLARFDLIPTGPLTELAEHYGRGAAKYANHQWRQGYEWSKSYAALMRHLVAFWAGQDYDVCSNEPDNCKPWDGEGDHERDPDTCFNHTGSHHMAAVAWHAFLLLDFKDAHQGHDDRYRPKPTLTQRADDLVTLAEAGMISATCGHAIGPVSKLGGEILVCIREPHGSASWGKHHMDADAVQVGAGRIRETYDMPEPVEPIHAAVYVGERAKDLLDAEQPIRDLALRWVEDYDAEFVRDRTMTYSVPRVKVPGLPTLAEATKFDRFFDSMDFSGFRDVVTAEVERLTRAADAAVERRFREQIGPDLLSKRSRIDWSGRSSG